MTTLHYLLIGLAVLLVGGVMLYNFLQERRLRKQIDGMFERGLEDAGRATLPVPEAAPTDKVAAGADTSPGESDSAPDTYDEMITLMRRASQDSDDDGLPLPTLADDEIERPMPESASGTTRETPPMLDMRAPITSKAPASPVAERHDSTESPSPAATPQPRAIRAPAHTEPSPLDDTIECVARIRLGERPVASYAALIDALGRVGKPTRAYVQDEHGRWRPLNAKVGTDIAIEAGVQWVDRKGALGETQFDAFCGALYDFVAEHGGAVTCPERPEALRQARSLDAFCVEVDVLIGLNIVAHEGMPFSGRRVDELARQADMTLDGLGAYVLRDAAGRALFSLANRDGSPLDTAATTPAVTLLFDVPNVDNGLAVFDRMTELGFAMARGLGGRMVDDRGHAVSDASLRKDREQLGQFYARMRAQGIPAGGERARRLFA